MILQKIKKLCKACGTVVIVNRSGYYIAVKSGYQIIAVLAAEKLPKWVADKLHVIYGSALISQGAESFDRGRLIPYEPDRGEASENV